MNRFTLAALLVAAVVSTAPAWAGPQDDHAAGGRQQGQANRPAQAQRQPKPQGERQPHAQTQPRTQQPTRAERQPLAQAQRHPQGQRGDQAQVPPQGQPHTGAQAELQARAQVQRRGDAPQGGGFRYGGSQHERIRAPSYSYPQGYGYRRWGVGQDIPLLFLSSQYFFDSYADYGIRHPPFGYRWVRYGPDLLLVNNRTGRVLQVIHGAFY